MLLIIVLTLAALGGAAIGVGVGWRFGHSRGIDYALDAMRAEVRKRHEV